MEKMEPTVTSDLAQLNLNDSNFPTDSMEDPYGKGPLLQISTDTPLEDYEYNKVVEMEFEYADGDEFEKYYLMNTFVETRRVLWLLLFGEPTLTDENFKKASVLLEDYRFDALMYAPRGYNLWIPKVRDELLKRKYFEFWHEIIVKKQLGICWSTDAKFAQDMLDAIDPDEFYKVGEDFIKRQTV